MTINVTKISTFTDGISVIVGLSLCLERQIFCSPWRNFQYKGDNFLWRRFNVKL